MSFLCGDLCVQYSDWNFIYKIKPPKLTLSQPRRTSIER